MTFDFDSYSSRILDALGRMLLAAAAAAVFQLCVLLHVCRGLPGPLRHTDIPH